MMPSRLAWIIVNTRPVFWYHLPIVFFSTFVPCFRLSNYYQLTTSTQLARTDWYSNTRILARCPAQIARLVSFFILSFLICKFNAYIRLYCRTTAKSFPHHILPFTIAKTQSSSLYSPFFYGRHILPFTILLNCALSTCLVGPYVLSQLL